MPEKLSKNSDGTYKVTGPHGVHAKSTSKENAQAQIRLLNAIDHGFKPTNKPSDVAKAHSSKTLALMKKHDCAGC